MWTQVQKMLKPTAANTGGAASVPVIPLRKSLAALAGLDVDKAIRFSHKCPLLPLSAAQALVVGIREYRFGADVIKSYQLRIGAEKQYFMTVAQDDQGQYLGISRALSADEQDSWFGRDALSFFTEQCSAKSIRCKADLMIEGEWVAARYSKLVDWVEGSVAPAKSPRLARSFHYNLLVNEAGDKALEIEHEDSSGENRIYVTVYRPIEDIAGIDVAAEEAGTAPQEPLLKTVPPLSSQPQQPKHRQDFRRLNSGDSVAPIRIERTDLPIKSDDETQDLPSFLLSHEETHISLDALIPPESERVRVGIKAARGLIEYAIRKNVRVRDVLRGMLGLESALSEEVIFEMPLTDADYRTLAMRYKLRPDHRIEIRSRLEQELSQKLTEIV